MHSRAEWQANAKYSIAAFGLEFNFAPMPVGNNAVTDHQTEPGAGADSFGAEERLENSVLNFGWDAVAVVLNLNDDVAVFRARRDDDATGAFDSVDRVV